MANNKETEIQRRIMLAASQNEAVTFRNNVGRGVLGKAQRIERAGTYPLNQGDWIVRQGRMVDFGVCNPGGSDLIGWKTVTVTPEMVGRKLAVFTALEVKTATGTATSDQVRFMGAVQGAGGLTGVVRSEEDAVQVLKGVEHA